MRATRLVQGFQGTRRDERRAGVVVAEEQTNTSSRGVRARCPRGDVIEEARAEWLPPRVVAFFDERTLRVRVRRGERLFDLVRGGVQERAADDVRQRVRVSPRAQCG